MSQRSAGSALQLCQQDGDEQSHSVESRRLVSEDYSHYILINKGEGGYDASFTQTGCSLFSRKVFLFLEGVIIKKEFPK